MFGFLQGTVLLIMTTVCFVAEVAAVIDCARRPAGAFVSAGKRSKNFWLLLTGGSAAVGFLGLEPPLGIGYLGVTALFVAIPAFIYFADVRPAVSRYGGGKNQRRNKNSGW